MHVLIVGDYVGVKPVVQCVENAFAEINRVCPSDIYRVSVPLLPPMSSNQSNDSLIGIGGVTRSAFSSGADIPPPPYSYVEPHFLFFSISLTAHPWQSSSASSTSSSSVAAANNAVRNISAVVVQAPPPQLSRLEQLRCNRLVQVLLCLSSIVRFNSLVYTHN